MFLLLSRMLNKLLKFCDAAWSEAAWNAIVECCLKKLLNISCLCAK